MVSTTTLFPQFSASTEHLVSRLGNGIVPRTNDISHAFIITCEVVRIIESLLAIAGNGLTIACIIKYKRLRQATNYLVASLAFADLVSGVNHIVFLELMVTTNPHHWKMLCIANQTVAMLVTASNVIHIAIIAVDRYLAVSRPVSYKYIVTKKRVVIFMIAQWVFSLALYVPIMLMGTVDMTGYEDVCSFMFLVPPKWFNMSAIPLVILASIITVTSYTLLFCRLRRHTRRMSHSIETSPQRAATHEMVEQSVTRAMLIVVLVFAISTLPPVIYTVAAPKDASHRPYVSRIVIILWYISSFTNPFIYAWKKQRYREAFKAMLTCGTTGNNDLIDVGLNSRVNSVRT